MRLERTAEGIRGRVDVTNEGRDTPLPREVQDTIDDLFDLVTVWEDYAKKADRPEGTKSCYLAAACTRDAIRLIRILYAHPLESGQTMLNRE